MSKLLIKAMSNRDPDLFYSIELDGSRIVCSCPANRIYRAACIHLKIINYFTKHNKLPNGYFETNEGKAYFKITDKTERIDLEEAVKYIRDNDIKLRK